MPRGSCVADAVVADRLFVDCDGSLAQVELVVQAPFEGVVIQVHLGGAHEGRYRATGDRPRSLTEEVLRLEVDVDVFRLDRPAVSERIFRAGAYGVADHGLPVVDARDASGRGNGSRGKWSDDRGTTAGADDCAAEAGGVDATSIPSRLFHARPRHAASRVEHPLVDHVAEATTQRCDPALVGLVHELRVEWELIVRLSLFVERAAVAFDADHPRAPRAGPLVLAPSGASTHNAAQAVVRRHVCTLAKGKGCLRKGRRGCDSGACGAKGTDRARTDENGARFRRGSARSRRNT